MVLLGFWVGKPLKPWYKKKSRVPNLTFQLTSCVKLKPSIYFYCFFIFGSRLERYISPLAVVKLPAIKPQYSVCHNMPYHQLLYLWRSVERTLWRRWTPPQGMLGKLDVKVPRTPDPGLTFKYKTLNFSVCEGIYFAYEKSGTALKEWQNCSSELGAFGISKILKHGAHLKFLFFERSTQVSGCFIKPHIVFSISFILLCQAILSESMSSLWSWELKS